MQRIEVTNLKDPGIWHKATEDDHSGPSADALVDSTFCPTRSLTSGEAPVKVLATMEGRLNSADTALAPSLILREESTSGRSPTLIGMGTEVVAEEIHTE